MASPLIAYRYVAFVLFIICSVVTISIAAWNLSLSQAMLLPDSSVSIDAFLIFVGALGTVCLLPIMFIDLLWRNAFTSQVRFECALMCVFWLLQMTGAAATTINSMSTITCLPHSPQIAMDFCTSTTVLLAFTWITAINTMVYFCLLMIVTLIHSRDDQQVWKASTLEYPWFSIREPLASAPASPTHAGKKPFIMSAAPGRPRRTSFSKRMFGSGQPDLEKQAPPMPGRSARLVQQFTRMTANESRFPKSAPHGDTMRSTREGLDLSRVPSPTESASSSSAESSSYSSDTSSQLSPATNPRHPRGKRTRHSHRPPPLDLSSLSSFRTAPQPDGSQQ
ncbi:hypothetical protein B0H21DRAFT_17260 [Amylocystis lapponica]|nr:hypothetical protein B0H21DRAFT_17260 [Amylocystis lapponica]